MMPRRSMPRSISPDRNRRAKRPTPTATKVTDRCHPWKSAILAWGLLFIPWPASGAEVPFDLHLIINKATAADGAVSVVAGDVDGDGDIDIVSASADDGRIIWYEHDGGAPPAFRPRIITDTLVKPKQIEVVDLDGDGDLDVLAASEDDDTVSWYENNAANPPEFTKHVVTEDPDGIIDNGNEGFADRPRSIASADLDDDGDLDMISVSHNDGKVAWYESDGASPPHFTPIEISTTARYAKSVHAEDIDGDGDQDLIVGSRGANRLAWYENDGANPPVFTERRIETEHSFTSSVLAADLDGDGDMDAAAAYEDDVLAWYENVGLEFPEFIERTISIDVRYAEFVFASDVDGDGDLDLISASKADDKIIWWENDGAAPSTFSERVITQDPDANLFNGINGFARSPHSVFAVDLDDDGDQDVLSASNRDDKIAWWENDGAPNPHFSPHDVNAAVHGPLTIRAADLDADGDQDVLSASFLDDNVTWFENQGGSPPQLTARVIVDNAMGAEALHTADLDGDGDIDPIVGDVDDNRVIWFENDGATVPSFTEHTISYRARHCESVWAADLDGDGDVDVLSASSIDDKIAWYENDGGSPPEFITRVLAQRPHSFTDSPLSVRAADIDGDGDIDILTASLWDDRISWFENDGGSSPVFTPRIITTEIDGGRSVFAADFDGDGDLDLATASLFDNKIAWLENDGLSPPFFFLHVISTNAIWANWVHADDVDGDGDVDIVSASLRDKKIAWYENLGGLPPVFSEHVLDTNFDGAWSVFVADLNGDGFLDVLAASFEDDKIGWFENLTEPKTAAALDWTIYD